MKGVILGLLLGLLFLSLSVGCGSTFSSTVDPETFTIVDRQTGEVFYPDLDPEPEITGNSITFIQDGEAFILNGNWLVKGELR